MRKFGLEEENLLGKYNEQAGPVANIRGEIAKVLDFLEKQRRTGLQRVELELETAITQQATMQRQLAQVNDELHGLEARGPALRDLQRRLERAEADYKSYATKLEEERITSQLDQEKISSVVIVQRGVGEGAGSSDAREDRPGCIYRLSSRYRHGSCRRMAQRRTCHA